jgi:mannitol/fructose-specific phosphotransferase system IIA component (Ntr-type)
MSGIKLDKRLIFVNVEDTSRDQIFQMMCGKLQECGYVKETYYQALQDREKEYPTGIQGQYLAFAMPHTYPEHVLKSGICVAVCRHAIPFGSMEDSSLSLPCTVIFHAGHHRSEAAPVPAQAADGGDAGSKAGGTPEGGRLAGRGRGRFSHSFLHLPDGRAMDYKYFTEREEHSEA